MLCFCVLFDFFENRPFVLLFGSLAGITAFEYYFFISPLELYILKWRRAFLNLSKSQLINILWVLFVYIYLFDPALFMRNNKY